MFHFSGNPTCSERTSDAEARVSVAPDLKTFRDCQIVNARYCAECAGIRPDSDRYTGIPWRYSRDRRRSKSAPFHPLNRCMELVDAGQWTLGPELCDGSGVLPARKEKP